MLAGILQSGTAAAREYENETVKELLLSPARRWAVILGKMLGAFVMSIASVIVVLCVLILVIRVWPVHWGEVIGFTLLSLMIFIAFGTLLGTLLKMRQPMIALAFGTSIPLFFLSGAFGPISFTTPVVQVIAQTFPIYYAIVLQQHAFHNFILNTYGIGVNALILGIYALALLALASLVLRRSNVAH